MQIQHFGNTFVRLQVKSPHAGDSIILIDPYETKNWGLRQPKTDGEIVLFTSGKINTKIIPKDVFVAHTPGEFETREISMYGIDAGEAGGIVYVLKIEDLTVGHIGSVSNTMLSKRAVEFLDTVDILMLPIGGEERLDGKQAARLVQELEPRIVIPLYYSYNGITAKVNDHSTFLKELGIKKFEETQKLTIKKKDLPAEETVVALVHL